MNPGGSANTHRLTLAATILMVTVGTGCDSTPTAPSACGSQGSLSAQIDGVAWSASCVAGLSGALSGTGESYIEVIASTVDGTQRLTFRVYATKPGTYLLGGPELGGGSMNSSAGVNIGCLSRGVCPAWIVPTRDGKGSGTVLITDLTGTGASGTFSFDFVANQGTGATGAKTVTNGRFNVRF